MDGSEIMVFHLLALRGRSSEKRPTADSKIGTGFVKFFRNHEILLLRPGIHDDPFGEAIAEQALELQTGIVQGAKGAQERGLQVEDVASPAEEN